MAKIQGIGVITIYTDDFDIRPFMKAVWQRKLYGDSTRSTSANKNPLLNIYKDWFILSF